MMIAWRDYPALLARSQRLRECCAKHPEVDVPDITASLIESADQLCDYWKLCHCL